MRIDSSDVIKGDSRGIVTLPEVPFGQAYIVTVSHSGSVVALRDLVSPTYQQVNPKSRSDEN